MNINSNQQSSSAQCARIKRDLLAGAKLTPIDALNRYGCFRLGARIWDLRHIEGMDIKSDSVITATGKRVARYYLNTTNNNDNGNE